MRPETHAAGEDSLETSELVSSLRFVKRTYSGRTGRTHSATVLGSGPGGPGAMLSPISRMRNKSPLGGLSSPGVRDAGRGSTGGGLEPGSRSVESLPPFSSLWFQQKYHRTLEEPKF